MPSLKDLFYFHVSNIKYTTNIADVKPKFIFWLIVWGHGIQVERLLFFRDKVWEEVKFLYGLWKEKFFIGGEEAYEEIVDVYDKKEPALSSNGRIYDSYQPSKLILGEYGIPFRRINEYYRLWNEYQGDNERIKNRYVSLLLRDVML